jgi:hypothetical protein
MLASRFSAGRMSAAGSLSTALTRGRTVGMTDEVMTWEEVACMSFILLMIGPGLPGPGDPFEFCLTEAYLTHSLSFFNMFISFFSNFLHLKIANTLFYMKN